MKISRTEPPAARRAAVGARQGPRRPVRAPRRVQEVRTSIVDQYGTVGRPIGRLQAPSCVGRHVFFSAKIDTPLNFTYILVLLQLAKWLFSFKLYRNSVRGCMVDAKSYFTNAKTHHDEASQMTDQSPDVTTCDMERRSLAHPPLARAPRHEITACDQVPHSDLKLMDVGRWVL